MVDGAEAFNPSYVGPRRDVARLVPLDCHDILDVGCAVGALGEFLQSRARTRVFGIESDAAMAEVARHKLHKVLVADVEDWAPLERQLQSHSFDCVICADVLEHLHDPWRTLQNLVGLLRPGGHVVASLPNVGHLDTLLNVFLVKRWPYRSRGIHDRTHLRAFARRNVLDLFEGAGLDVLRLERNFRVIERPHRANRVARYLAVPPLRDLLTYQYLVVGRRNER